MTKNNKIEMCFLIDSDFLNVIRRRLSITQEIELTKVAFTLLDWASSEIQKGRIILSSTENGEEPRHLIMPELVRMTQ